MTSIVDAALRIKQDPSRLIDPEVVADACARTNHAWRDRVLSPAVTLDLFAEQIARGNTPIAHMVRLHQAGFSESAYCQARQRIPVDVFRAAVRLGTDRLIGQTAEPAGTWKGHPTLIADGTGCDMPDTPDLMTHFGQASCLEPGCAFPVAHVLTLFDAQSSLLVDIAVSPIRTGDLTRMPQMHRHLRPNDLLIGDRIFSSYAHFATLQALGVHALCRAHQSRRMTYPASSGPRERYPYNRHRRKTPVLVELLGPEDQIVEIVKRHNRDNWLTREQFARLAPKIRVRVLKFRVHERGFRSHEIELMTTLLDPVKYPAADLAELYFARWRVEVNLRNLKRTLGMTTLRCKTVEGVTKELLMFALVYNAVCAVMMEAAVRQGVRVQRISFLDALRWMCCRGEEEELPRLKVNPLRRGRLYARYLKRSATYPRLLVPRAIWKKRYLDKYWPN